MQGDKSRVSHGIQTTSLLFQATEKKHGMMGVGSAWSTPSLIDPSGLSQSLRIIGEVFNQNVRSTVIAGTRLGPSSEEIHDLPGCSGAARVVGTVTLVLVGVCKLAVVLLQDSWSTV